MQPSKKLFSNFNDAEIGSIDMKTGDFFSKYTKSVQSRNPARSQIQGFKGHGAYQDGYTPSQFQPAERIAVRMNQPALKKVSSVVASEGQKDKGVVSW